MHIKDCIRYLAHMVLAYKNQQLCQSILTAVIAVDQLPAVVKKQEIIKVRQYINHVLQSLTIKKKSSEEV